MELIFLDTETTGLESGRLIQLAYKKRGADGIVVEYYKPPVPIEIEAMATHHITEKMIADKPCFKDTETCRMLSDLLPRCVVIAHNAKFDLGILQNEGLSAGPYICTYKVAQALYDCPKYKLQYLRYLWSIELENATAHDAEGDVLVLERIFERMLQEYCASKAINEEQALEDFINISSRPLLLKKLDFGKHAGKTFEEIKAADPGYLSWLSTLADKGEDFQHTVRHHLAGENAGVSQAIS
ncbi:MAG TPA: exonuclease domain-containing protein [Candidatus Paceibacterota bacterium]|nr:exonuclease domain-containing protein [Candidatus Paceibacterota bacterium]